MKAAAFSNSAPGDAEGVAFGNGDEVSIVAFGERGINV
jgi:hypothetical protein